MGVVFNINSAPLYGSLCGAWQVRSAAQQPDLQHGRLCIAAAGNAAA